jgi:PII-like signaling protein
MLTPGPGKKVTVYVGELPVMVCIVDHANKIEEFLPVLESMVNEGLIAMSDVEVIRYAALTAACT